MKTTNLKISEAFIVDIKIFDSAIEELVKLDKPVPVINTGLLEKMGYVDLNSRLLVKVLKELDIVTTDGKPGELFDEFSNPSTTKKALAKGLINAYESLFEDNPSIHHKNSKEINEQFTTIFGEEKTELIIQYISETFIKIVSYCGTSVIDDVLEQLTTQEAVAQNEINGQVNYYAENNGNGSHSDKRVSGDENYARVFKDIGTQSIGDIITKFDDSRTNNLDTEYFEEGISIKNDNNDKQDDDSSTAKMVNPQNGAATDSKDLSVNEPSELSTNEELSITEEDDSSEPASGESSDKNTELIQKAVFQRAELYFKLQRWEDLLPALNQIIKKYEQSDNPKTADVVSRSVIRRAKALFKLKQFDKALPALDAIIDRLKDSEVKEFYHQVSLAMLYKVQLIENNDSEDANEALLPLYNGIINRLDDHSNSSIREKVDAIHFKRFDIIIKKGEKQDILKSSTQLVNRFRDETENPEYLKLAMIKRAEILEEMNRDEEALEAYNEFLAIFG